MRGNAMYGGSDVVVGTVGRAIDPSSITQAEARSHGLKTLVEGGAWAVEKDRRHRRVRERHDGALRPPCLVACDAQRAP
jgi:hypothetical protein